MSPKTLRLVVVVLVVSLVGLNTGAAQVLPLSGPHPAARLSLAALVRDWLAGWQASGLVSLFGKEGSSMDPNGGKTTPGSAPADGMNGDEGSQMDPNGTR